MNSQAENPDLWNDPQRAGRVMQERTALDDQLSALSRIEQELGDQVMLIELGDAENDHDLLTLCGCSVAVANAIPALRQRADVVTHGSYGAGVLEVIHRLIDRNSASVSIC